jgi:hypothetical protein
MKKMKHEAELFKAALVAGVAYAEGRKAVEFEATDSERQGAHRLALRGRNLAAPKPIGDAGHPAASSEQAAKHLR